MNQITLDQILSEDEFLAVGHIWNDDRTNFHRRVVDEILAPNMARINASIGQENDVDYLAYLLESIFWQRFP